MQTMVDLELDLQGAFPEDALTEVDALASRVGLVGDVVPSDDMPDDFVVSPPAAAGARGQRQEG